MCLVTLSKREWGLVAGFILLNLVDLLLTEKAIQLGSQELNPVLGLGDFWSLKTMFATAAVCLLILFRKVRFLKWVNVGLAVIVVYNSVAVWSWS